MTSERTPHDRAPSSAAAHPWRALAARLARPRRTPQHILVSILCPIGDTLLATPALGALRRQFPEAHITALVSSTNAGILEHSPDLDALVRLPSMKERTALRAVAQGVRGLRAHRYDLVVNFSAAGTLLTRLAGLRGRRLGLDTPPLWWLWGGHSRAYRERHTVDQYLRALAPVVPLPQRAEERVPRFTITAAERATARRLLREHGISPSQMLVTLHLGAEGLAGRKQWAPTRFAAVANALIERYDAQIVLVGGRSERGLAAQVAALVPTRCTVLTGQTSLQVTGAVIAASTLFLGNDSCPLHIAAAVGTPAVGIYGPSDWQTFRPVGPEEHALRVVHSDLPCSPCYRFVGNRAPWLPNLCHSRACLKAITPQHVLEAAVALLAAEAGTPATEAPREPLPTR